jgi:hypothetical protein
MVELRDTIVESAQEDVGEELIAQYIVEQAMLATNFCALDPDELADAIEQEAAAAGSPDE